MNSMVSIGMGLDGSGALYWGQEYPFIDRFKTAGQWGLWGLPAGTTVQTDASGNPVAMPSGVSQLYTLANVEPTGLPMTDRYVLTWQGNATIAVSSQHIVSSEPGKIVFDYDGSSNQVMLTLSGVTGAGSVHDIHLVRQDQLDLFNKGEIFNPAFVDKVSQWDTLRFMDWAQTNNNLLANWDDRPKATDASWGTKGVPIEVMVALANEAKTDMWYNVPAHATDDFVRQAMTYIRDHLDPKLQLHLEYSNEVWNWQFEQSHYADAMGKALDASLPAGWVGAFGETHVNWATWAGYRAAQVAQISEQVFGNQADARLVNVLATQTAWTELSDYIFAGVKLANGGQVGSLFEDYAVTTYFGGGLMGNTADDRAKILAWAKAPGTTGLDAAFNEIFHGGSLSPDDSLDHLGSVYLAKQQAVAQKYGLNLVAYEGGYHITATNFSDADQPAILDFFTRLLADPRSGTAYTQMATIFADHGGTLLNAFVDTGAVSKWGLWGTLNSTYDNHSPRYDALVNVEQTKHQAIND